MSSAPRYVIYTRVSTQEQDQNNSHQSQLEALMLHVERKGGVVVRRVRETASGGLFLGRPGIRSALQLLEEDSADVLACFDFSRYSRDEVHQQEMLRFVQRLEDKRIEFTNFELEYDEDGNLKPQSQLMFGVSGNFVAFHKAQIRSDTMRGAKQAAENGFQTKRKSPYGYRVVTKEDYLAERFPGKRPGEYVIVEEEAAIMREIFLRRSRGEGLTTICKDLNLRGITTRNGAIWRPSRLSEMFANSVYMGVGHYGERRRVNDESRLDRGWKRSFTYRKRPKEKVTTFEVPPLVETSLWQSVNAMKTEIPNGALGDHRARYLLSTVLKCPHCGGPMVGRVIQRPVSGVGRGRKKAAAALVEPSLRPQPVLVSRRYYVCRAAHLAEKGNTCPARHYRTEQFDTRVLNTLREMCNEKFLREMLLARSPAPVNRDAAKYQALQNQIEELTTRERALLEIQLTNLTKGIESDTHDEMLRETVNAKKALQGQLAELEARNLRPSGRGGEKMIREQLKSLRHLLDDPQSLEPLSASLQALHSALLVMFERIDFEESKPHTVDALKLTLRV